MPPDPKQQTFGNKPLDLRPGRAFRDGKLYEFSRTGIIVASQWPDMRAWRKTPKGRWKQIRPLMHLRREGGMWTLQLMPKERRVRPFGRIPPIRLRLRAQPDVVALESVGPDFGHPGLEGCEALGFIRQEWEIKQDRLADAYLHPVPETLKRLAASFPSRHWHLLNLLARCPGADEPLASSPALGFALASCWVFRERRPSHPWRSVRSLLKQRRTRIAEWLGFHGDASTLRTLEKLAPADCSIPALLILRRILPERKMVLRHMRYLNLGLLRLLECEGESFRMSPRFLNDASESRQRMGEAQARVRDLLWLEQNHGGRRQVTLHSWDELVSRHDRMVDRLNRPDLRIRSPYVLPRPPYPDPPLRPDGFGLVMEPLRNEEQLRIEGAVQRNCTGRLGDHVAEGRIYLYRMLRPERATVAVAPTGDGGWRLSEIKAAENREVDAATVAAALRWAEEASRRIRRAEPP